MVSSTNHEHGSSELDVVILNWRDEARTAACVESLVGQRGIRHIYVVDNESRGLLSSGVDDFALPAKILEVPENRGFSGGVNVALDYRRLAGDRGALLVLNNDVIVPDGSVESLISFIDAHPEAGVIGTRLANPDGSVQAIGHRVGRFTGVARPNRSVGRVDFVSWACVAISEAAQAAVGNLDEGFFMYWEDFDFSQRALKEGFGLEIASEVTVVHELSASGSSAGTLLREYYAWSLHVLTVKYGGWLAARAYLAYALLVAKQVMRNDQDAMSALRRGWKRPISDRAYLDL